MPIKSNDHHVHCPHEKNSLSVLKTKLKKIAKNSNNKCEYGPLLL